MCDVNWLFNVIINDISVIYVTARSARPSTDTGLTFLYGDSDTPPK